MILKYSEKKSIPYIEFENGDRLSFSTTTERLGGFKYLCFNGSTTTVVMSTGKGKSKKKKVKGSFKEPVAFTITMKFDKIPKKATKGTALSPITKGILKKIFSSMITKDGLFPRNKLLALGERLEMLDAEEEEEEE